MKKMLTIRQKILKWVYPLFVSYKKRTGRNTQVQQANVEPRVSFYDLSVVLNTGVRLGFEELRDKKVLLVNTASNCGYTNQYSELQDLYQQNKGELLILGFPSNDFKEQEKGSDEEIAKFCQVNFGVSFPLARKSRVIKGAEQNKVFEWLTHKDLNGWNDQQPSWNFSKYLVNEQGMLTHYFDPAVSPLGEAIIKAIEKK